MIISKLEAMKPVLKVLGAMGEQRRDWLLKLGKKSRRAEAWGFSFYYAAGVSNLYPGFVCHGFGGLRGPRRKHHGPGGLGIYLGRIDTSFSAEEGVICMGSEGPVTAHRSLAGLLGMRPGAGLSG